PDHIAIQPALADQHAALLRLFKHFQYGLRMRLFCLAVFDELHALHQTHSAHVADNFVAFLQTHQLFAQVISDYFCVVRQVLLFDHFDRGHRRAHRYGIAAEGRESCFLDRVGDLRTRDCPADGRAVGHAFGRSDDVRFDVPMLDAEPFVAEAAPARLDFVADEDAAVLANDRDGLFEILFRRGDESADAHDRLRPEGGGLGRTRGLDPLPYGLGAGYAAFWIGGL